MAGTTTTHTSGTAGARKEATMADPIRNEVKGDTVVVDLSMTRGQESAIEANGSPIFVIEVTWPVEVYPPAKDGTPNEAAGFGRVVSDGPVKGYEVLYTSASVTTTVAA